MIPNPTGLYGPFSFDALSKTVPIISKWFALEMIPNPTGLHGSSLIWRIVHKVPKVFQK